MELLLSEGGAVRALTLVKNGRPLPVLCGDPRNAIAENEFFRGRVLYPFNDRIRHGRYSFGEKDYELNLNDGDHAIHGQVYKTSPQVRVEGSTIELGYETPVAGFQGYPFRTALTITYTLEESKLAIDYRISSLETSAHPVGLGWHPYFMLPGELASWQLRLPGDSYVPADSEAFPLGHEVPSVGSDFDFAQARSLGHLELDHAFSWPSGGKLQLISDEHCITMVQTGSIFRYAQVFIPPDRRSIALEPVSSPCDSWNPPHLGRLLIGGGTELRSHVDVLLS